MSGPASNPRQDLHSSALKERSAKGGVERGAGRNCESAKVRESAKPTGSEEPKGSVPLRFVAVSRFRVLSRFRSSLRTLSAPQLSQPNGRIGRGAADAGRPRQRQYSTRP